MISKKLYLSALALSLYFILASGSALAKGPPDKVTIEGPGLPGEVEITDPRLLQPFSFFLFEDIRYRIPPPPNRGQGYVITRYIYRKAQGEWIPWDRLIYYPSRNGSPGIVFLEGLNVWTEYHSYWYLVSPEGDRTMRQIFRGHPAPCFKQNSTSRGLGHRARVSRYPE